MNTSCTEDEKDNRLLILKIKSDEFRVPEKWLLEGETDKKEIVKLFVHRVILLLIF